VLEGLLSSSAATEAELVSVERIRQLLDAPQEKDTIPVSAQRKGIMLRQEKLLFLSPLM